MSIRQIKPKIFSVGTIDWDRRIFDELIPLPDGTSYNSYLIEGSEKTALIDTVDPTKIDELLKNLSSLDVDKIDYVIANHAEQDHSGGLPFVLDKFPMAKVVTNAKCKNLLMIHLHIPEDKFIEIGDNDTISLGDKTLQFIMTPWVHWPETMTTYIPEDKILFTCDFFGSHLATSDMYVEDKGAVYIGAKRYYAEIMMPFRKTVANNVKKIENLDIKIIAPSHGPLYNEPKFIIDAYKDWTSDDVKNEVIIPYVSMHGSTQILVDRLVEMLIDSGIYVKPFNIPYTDTGELAMALVDAATVVVGTPTVLAGAHPAAVYATFLFNALRPKTRFVSIIGSFGWGGRAVEQLAGLLTNVKPEIIEPVIVKGCPDGDAFKKLERLANEIIKRHNGLTSN
ncbi:FprA family A-type flavoprotein [bacterium]|nr:FprA family A-type flavoprotein [bacterium]